jgi:hypothetical protein
MPPMEESQGGNMPMLGEYPGDNESEANQGEPPISGLDERGVAPPNGEGVGMPMMGGPQGGMPPMGGERGYGPMMAPPYGGMPMMRGPMRGPGPHMMQEHIQRLEAHVAHIEALLQELVNLEKQKQEKKQKH